MRRSTDTGFWRLPVAGRLALVFCALAVFSTASTLLLQDRALDRDLERAARLRLDRSARAADQLLRSHLRSVAERYAAVSRTPELRANLEIDHSQTLIFFADQLRKDHGAALISFQGPDDRIVAWSGIRRLARSIPPALRQLGEQRLSACIEIDDVAAPEPDRVNAGAYLACEYPTPRIQATAAVLEDGAYAIAAIPLTTASRRVGLMLVAEAIESDLIDGWSSLCGAHLSLAAAGPDAEDDLVTTAARFPSGALWISSSLETERLSLLRSRRNLLFSGLLALAAAFAASLALARSLSRPLRAMQEAIDRISRGDLSTRLGSRRHDELGDLSHSFDSMLDRLEETRKRLRRVQKLARFGEWTLRFDTGRVEASPELQRALGIPASAPLELSLTEMLDRIHPEDRGVLRRELDRCRGAELSFELQVRSSGAPGTRTLVLRGRSLAGADGISRLEGSVTDVTEQKRVEEQIRYLTYHNPVTGLANVRFFRERLRRIGRRGRHEPFAVVLVGLDNFQMLNETHGHSFGDAVLRGTASRLLEAITSPNADPAEIPALAHLGGDEFALLFDAVSSLEQARRVAEELLERISHPHVVEGEEIVVSASIGICLGTPQVAPEALLRNCDSALRRAKDAGRGRIEFFDEHARAVTSRRLRIDGGLRRALERDLLELHYQPRLAADSEAVVCFEALLRWTDEELGAVPPSEFIPIAEQSGLIQSIGSWALARSLEQLRRWGEAGCDRAKVSINLSPHQFHRDIDVEIRELLQGLDPQRIELEVTEYALLQDEEAAIGAMRRLRDAGFRISLDDFGTGYSSLSYLRKLPLDAIKIDRSFISHMDQDPDAAALIAAIIAMARTLRLQTVAEGVETAEQRELLIEMGCDELQGFYYSPAVPADAALRMLTQPRDQKPTARSRRSRRAKRRPRSD